MYIALATARDLPTMDQDDEILRAALDRRGARVATPVWDDPQVEWSAFDAVVIRSTWDYTDRRDQFVRWARSVEGGGTRLHNSADVVEWNTHKGYLMELEDRGAPIVPTAWLGRGDQVELSAIALSRGWSSVVAKPAVAAGSRGLLLVEGIAQRSADRMVGDQEFFAALCRDHDVLVQPLLSRVRIDGELSCVCVQGRFKFCVRKRPVGDDIRIQVEFGGSYERVDPPAGVPELAEWVVESTGQDLLFARVDLLPADDGTWLLGELEVTEPALYLDHHAATADILAAAILGG